MVDLNRALASMLKGVARVELEFPSVNEKFPVITIKEVTNTEDFSVDGAECISDITYQVDVWDNDTTRERCENIAITVSNILTQNNFSRILGRGFKDESGLHRKMMYFSAKVIN